MPSEAVGTRWVRTACVSKNSTCVTNGKIEKALRSKVQNGLKIQFGVGELRDMEFFDHTNTVASRIRQQDSIHAFVDGKFYVPHGGQYERMLGLLLKNPPKTRKRQWADYLKKLLYTEDAWKKNTSLQAFCAQAVSLGFREADFISAGYPIYYAKAIRAILESTSILKVDVVAKLARYEENHAYTLRVVCEKCLQGFPCDKTGHVGPHTCHVFS